MSLGVGEAHQYLRFEARNKLDSSSHGAQADRRLGQKYKTRTVPENLYVNYRKLNRFNKVLGVYNGYKGVSEN